MSTKEERLGALLMILHTYRVWGLSYLEASLWPRWLKEGGGKFTDAQKWAIGEFLTILEKSSLE